ncbi:MAG: hypothetical protein J3R72DRAFT_426463 [Linnemannia gamsii]|nr:MAG: hypothetical protein J3R72DRAFT_426463 [Linnemannia gamsii]
MPVVPSGRRNSTSSTNLLNNTSRCNTTSFAGATITLPKTLSNKSLDGYGHLVSDLPNLNSRTRSSSSAASGTSTIPLAPIIAAIHRGNFLALSEPILDVLIRSMAGKNSTALETINITGAAISASDAKLLARLIRSSDAANIKVLQLARNAISQQAIKYIFEAWKYNQTITTISLSRSGMNDKTVKYVSKMLAKNETLQELDLSSNRITATGMELLAEGLVYNRALTRLCLQSNNIKRAGAPFLARLLTKNRVLRHLNVGSNGLGTEGCSLIADAVRFNRTLNSLSLDMNEMGPKGATAMATALVSNRHLTYLYLPHNNIGDQGLVEICESLKRNRSLIGLDLELNNIGSAQSLVGMTALGDILKTNKSLREINLAYNLFSGDAIGELMKGVAVNSTLESINFTNCGISTEGALAIAEVLPSARGLQNLGLTSNPDIAVEGYWALSNNLAKNRSMKGIQLDYNSEDRHVLILVLSRVVLLGRPANQRLLQTQIQQQQLSSQSKGAWSLLKKKVGLSRTNSTNSYSSLLTINKHHANHEGHPVGSVSPLLLAVGSMSRATAVGAGSQDEREAGSGSIQNLPHGNRPTTPVSLGVPSLSLDVELGPLSRSNSSSNIRRDLHPLVLPHQQQQLMDQGLLLGSGGNVGFIDNGPGLGRPSSTRSISSSQLFYQAVVGEEYNAHKVLANLANMPYEIFETICAYLDPGHTMTISQIRMTIQVAGDRSTIAASGGYYTKDKMLEKIFLSRNINNQKNPMKPQKKKKTNATQDTMQSPLNEPDTFISNKRATKHLRDDDTDDTDTPTPAPKPKPKAKKNRTSDNSSQKQHPQQQASEITIWKKSNTHNSNSISSSSGGEGTLVQPELLNVTPATTHITDTSTTATISSASMSNMKPQPPQKKDKHIATTTATTTEIHPTLTISTSTDTKTNRSICKNIHRDTDSFLAHANPFPPTPPTSASSESSPEKTSTTTTTPTAAVDLEDYRGYTDEEWFELMGWHFEEEREGGEEGDLDFVDRQGRLFNYEDHYDRIDYVHAKVQSLVYDRLRNKYGFQQIAVAQNQGTSAPGGGDKHPFPRIFVSSRADEFRGRVKAVALLDGTNGDKRKEEVDRVWLDKEGFMFYF